jgi:stress response protein YsnF
MEEEVEITKRPVKKGEVRVTKTATEEQRTVSADVKEEKAKIDRDANLLDDEHRRIPH